MKYNIHLNVYDGPLDLLCDLISKQKIDIKDISILEITSQYLAYIDMLNTGPYFNTTLAILEVSIPITDSKSASARENITYATKQYIYTEIYVAT